MDERDLERIAGGLGRRAADRLDVAAVSRGVMDRLREAEALDRVVASRPRPVLRWLAHAAAVALIVAGSVVTFRATPPSGDPAARPAANLYELTSDELAEVLDSLSWNAPVSARFAAGLDDLDAEQLEQLLALMEG
jgi:hypothetical protein